VYWQYFEDLDRITSANTDLSLDKELYLHTHSNSGAKLKEITNKSPLNIGDKVTVRIILKTDRDMQFVQMKDMRAAGFEPLKSTSGYTYNNGLGYYQSSKDESVHFFFDYLPKGTHVFEYQLITNNAGKFSNGISIIECAYAPEFKSHSKGVRVEIKE